MGGGLLFGECERRKKDTVPIIYDRCGPLKIVRKNNVPVRIWDFGNIERYVSERVNRLCVNLK